MDMKRVKNFEKLTIQGPLRKFTKEAWAWVIE